MTAPSLRRVAPGEYETRDGRLRISQAENRSWYVFDVDDPGSDSIDFGPTLADVRSRLTDRRREIEEARR